MSADRPYTWNRYAYVHGDPINFRDPSGTNEANPDGSCSAQFENCNDEPGIGIGIGGGGGGGDGGGGGGGGNVEPASQGFLAGKDKARADLAKKDCYGMLGFGSAEAAQKWFDNGITFHNGAYGKLQLQNDVPAPTPAPANTVGYGQININTDYNWDDFSKVSTQQGGTFDYLRYINKGLGTNMTSDQLATLIILHELGHQETAPKQPSDVENAAEKIKIYNGCIK